MISGNGHDLDYRLIILGTPPPPRGGVTTHVERLLPHLDERSIRYDLWTFSGGAVPSGRAISLRRQPFRALASALGFGVRVLHAPLSRVTFSRVFFFLLLRILGVRSTITFVASPEQTLGSRAVNRRGLKMLTRLCRHFITANPAFKRLLMDLGVHEDSISVIPAFIPARLDESDKNRIPEEVRRFMSERSPVVVTYANGPDVHDGVDLYGLDMLPEMMKKLAAEFPDIGLVVVIPDINNQSGWDVFLERMEEEELSDRLSIAPGGNFSFVSLLDATDVFLRATNTDGDALTVREALFEGVPVAASDVCNRPEGVVLFKNRDRADLTQAVRECLSAPKNTTVPESARVNNAERFIAVFDRAAAV